MTSAVEQRKDFSDSFATHPMEAGWAGEALFFITAGEVSGPNPLLKARVQISVDGVNWLDEGTEFPPISAEGHYFVKVRHFGGWLRLQCDLPESGNKFNLTVHLVLKE